MPLIDELSKFRDAIKDRDWLLARHSASNVLRLVADLIDIARTGMSPTDEEQARCREICREIGNTKFARGGADGADERVMDLCDAVLGSCRFLGYAD